VIGVLVVSWRHRLPALAAVAFGAATLTAFWLSVKVGLFGFRGERDRLGAGVGRRG
jgi:hypothetical protein